MRVAGYQIGVIPLNIFKNTIAIVGFFLTLVFTSTALWIDLDIHSWALIALSGILGVTLADVFFVASLNRLGASLQALVDCVYAPSVILTAFILFGETIGTVEIIGGTLVGLAVLIGSYKPKEVKNRKALLSGIAFGVAAHILMAIGALVVRDIYQTHSLVWVCLMRFVFGNVFLILLAPLFVKGQPLFYAFTHRKTWKFTIPISILGAFMATLLWLNGFKYSLAGRAAIYNQMSTVFIVLLAIVILKEEITFRKLLSISLGILGALIISL